MSNFNTELVRFPEKHDPTLRAWDASDELIVDYVKNNISLDKKILVINDSFGAMTKNLHEYDCDLYTDSYLSSRAYEKNQVDKKVFNDLDGICSSYDIVLFKVPKNMSFMEDILTRLSQVLVQNTPLICTSMIKYLPRTAFDLINQYIGETTTSLAKKKARLVFSSFNKNVSTSKYPKSIVINDFKLEMINHSNIFSREKLDIGTRFFLENIPSYTNERILDIGCANGIVGIYTKLKNPDVEVSFSDESFMAIKSTVANYQRYFNETPETYWTNCFDIWPLKKIDAVLCNPPFHQATNVGDYIAKNMFKDSFKTLVKGGQIIVIGNRHLNYHITLKKIFGNCELINQNKKFVILKALKLRD